MNNRRSLIWPVVLILAGVVFLLNNLGVVNVDLWTVISDYWPLVFIIAGIDLLFFKRGNIGVYIGVLVVLGVVAVSSWANNTFDGRLDIGERITMPISHQIDDVDDVRMDIDMSIGELNIDALDMEGALIDGVITVGENERITDTLTVEGDSARYVLSSDGYSGIDSINFGNFSHEANLTWDLEISNAFPIDLSISSGVSESNIDLTGLMIEDFSYDGGVGEATITFPEVGTFDAHIDMGIGATTVYLPENLSVKIITSVGIGDVSVSGDYRVDGNGRYLSSGFDSSDGVTIYVDGGIGALDIIQIP
jgi:hypothetical protein